MAKPPSSLTCQEINQWDLVQYLSSLGFNPAKISSHQYWYCSPLRTERTPSFKVDRRLNCWYDHGLGKGGTVVDFALLYYGCSVRDLLHQLNNQSPVSFHPQKASGKAAAPTTNRLEVAEVGPLQSRSLLQYVKRRGVDTSIAAFYCCEVEFKLFDKPCRAIGFRNDAGGYELRNPWFKGSSSPKDITSIRNSEIQAGKLYVFEGFFDFLSYQSFRKNDPAGPAGFLILNSLAFLEKSRPLLEKFDQVALFLDHDASGRICTQKACAWSVKIQDESSLYKGAKDLSDWQEKQVWKRSRKNSRSL